MCNEHCNWLLMTDLLVSHGLVAVFCVSEGVHSLQGSHQCEGMSSNVHRIGENGSFCASGSSKWLALGLKRQKSSTDRFHVLFSTGWQGFIAMKPPLGREKTAMATVVTSATWQNSASQRRNNHRFINGYVRTSNVENGHTRFGVLAQNLL
jgi:hypothetical protein